MYNPTSRGFGITVAPRRSQSLNFSVWHRAKAAFCSACTPMQRLFIMLHDASMCLQGWTVFRHDPTPGPHSPPQRHPRGLVGDDQAPTRKRLCISNHSLLEILSSESVTRLPAAVSILPRMRAFAFVTSYQPGCGCDCP